MRIEAQMLQDVADRQPGAQHEVMREAHAVFDAELVRRHRKHATELLHEVMFGESCDARRVGQVGAFRAPSQHGARAAQAQELVQAARGRASAAARGQRQGCGPLRYVREFRRRIACLQPRFAESVD
jgi:hypothetical protein